MEISCSVLCKGVSLACFSWCVAFVDGLKTKTCFVWDMFFCMVVEEDAKHRFITCSVGKVIWVIISQIWASITGFIFCCLIIGFLFING